jgi:hypothetical protein
MQEVHRGYSMLFDEYVIYFTSETEFLIISLVRRVSINVISKAARKVF